MNPPHLSIAHVLRFASLVSLIAVCPRAYAQYTKYSDSGSFAAATSGLSTINFEGLAANNGSTSYSLPSGLTLSGVNFTIDERGDLPTAGTSGTNGVLKVNGQGTTYSGVSVLSSQVPSYGNQNIDIKLTTPVTALGIDFADTAQAKLFGYVLFDESGDYQSIGSVTPSSSGFSFFGITSTPSAPISEVVFSTTSPSPLYVKDFVSGTDGAASAPEPGALALLLPLSLPAMGALTRRRSARRSSNSAAITDTKERI